MQYLVSFLRLEEVEIHSVTVKFNVGGDRECVSDAFVIVEGDDHAADDLMWFSNDFLDVAHVALNLSHY